MITCKIEKKYGDRTVLQVNRSFEEGKIYVVIGGNGSGKSTFISALGGLIPFTGEITDVKNPVCMPQTTYNFDFGVKRNVLLFVGKKETEKRQKAEKMLQEIGLAPLEKKNARTLSGGEGQKTALLRTLLQKSDVLLLDEPTSSMDVTSTLIAEKLIKDYQQETGCTLFLVTHSVAQAERMNGEILFFDAGQLIESGKSITQSPSSPQLQTYLQNR